MLFDKLPPETTAQHIMNFHSTTNDGVSYLFIMHNGSELLNYMLNGWTFENSPITGIFQLSTSQILSSLKSYKPQFRHLTPTPQTLGPASL